MVISLGENMTMIFLYQLLAFLYWSLALFFSHQTENEKLRCDGLWNINYNKIYIRDIFRQLSSNPYHFVRKEETEIGGNITESSTSNTTSVIEVMGRS